MANTTTTTALRAVGTTRARRGGRRFSIPTQSVQRPPPLKDLTCYPLSDSLEALDLSSASPTQTLASLRFLVLSYLSDVEIRLAQLEVSIADLRITKTIKAKRELTVEEARARAKVALDMLSTIRAEVLSHLPDIHFADMSVESVEDFVLSRIPDLPDVAVPGLNNMRSHFPDMADVRARLPDMPDVRSRLRDFSLSEVRAKFEDVRSRFHDLDFKRPLTYVPILSDRLRSLHSHLSSMELLSGFEFGSFAPNTVLSDLLDALHCPEILADLVNASPDIKEAEDLLDRAATEIKRAITRSLEGKRLIDYVDLPHLWRNNPYVTRGYRFIPIERWPLIILSLFALHNETLNIHTHLVPFILWCLHSIPYLNPSGPEEVPEMAFIAFALLCLFTSALWHTMSGCAHPDSVVFCARVDYIGIGWLISASVGTVVYYGFQCRPELGQIFLVCCFLMGLAGNIAPFMGWFNQYEYRGWRVSFFVCLALTAVAPVASMIYLHSIKEVLLFILPVVPSLVSYVVGLVFYVTHIPERFLPERWSGFLDQFGGGSHAIWHAFIVLAISQHKQAIRSLRGGLACPSN